MIKLSNAKTTFECIVFPCSPGGGQGHDGHDDRDDGAGARKVQQYQVDTA